MEMSDRPTRNISEEFLAELTENNKEYLQILGIARSKECLILPRKDRVIIYYQGCKVLEIIENDDIKLENAYVKNINDVKKFFDESVSKIREKTDEKTIQQKMFFKINENNNDYFVFDMEYQQALTEDEKDGTGVNNNPRVDLVCIKRDGTFVCIEVKFGNGALTGEQGIAGHLESAATYFPKFEECEFKEMISQVNKLNDFGKTGFNLDWKKPKEYIFALIKCTKKDDIYKELKDAEKSIEKLEENGWSVYFTEDEISSKWSSNVYKDYIDIVLKSLW